MKIKKPILYTIEVIFAFVTVYIIIYAFYHREQSDLVYIIFNSYALLAVILSFVIVLSLGRRERRKRESARKRLIYFTKNLTAPAMLWNDNFTEVVLNDALVKISEMKMREDFDARYVVPLFFGKKEMTDEDIREVVLAKNKEYSFTTPSGTPRDIIWNTSSAKTDEDGVTWFLSIGLDLNDMRLMQSEIETYSKRLTVSEGRHNLTMELMDVGILLIEQGNPKLFPSDKLQKMLGISSSSLTVAELRERVYALDIMTFDNFVQKLRNRMIDYVGKPDVIELRLVAADNQYRWFSYRFKATQSTETGRLVLGGSVIDITKEKEKDAQIERIAYVDTITEIPNRSKLMQMGNELYECMVALQKSYWVIVMDIDRFHLINDTCGYAAGNELLRQFADILNRQQSVGGFGARISGDNFALILRDNGSEELPEKVVGRIQRTLATKAVGALANRALSCSAGYAKLPQDGATFEEVLEHAEFAMSSGSARQGKICRYTPAMRDSIVQESNLEAQLQEAVMRNELVLFYQPKVSLSTGKLIGLEALVRWKHPSGNLLSPSLFIPIAEKSMLITQITRFVMYEAIRQAKLWQTIGLPKVVMSINFSGTDFYQENICQQIMNALKKYDLEPQYLEIELTESLALKDIDMTISRMQDLRNAGINIAMDDFGTGYSSLSYLQRLPFTMVKLDRSFVIQITHDPIVQEIVHSVTRIAKTKQIQTIAEGVETPEQAQTLRDIGCDFVQGFLYGHPMDAKETEQFIRRNVKEKFVY